MKCVLQSGKQVKRERGRGRERERKWGGFLRRDAESNLRREVGHGPF